MRRIPCWKATLKMLPGSEQERLEKAIFLELELIVLELSVEGEWACACTLMYDITEVLRTSEARKSGAFFHASASVPPS
jgi:hypothetical protein